MEDWRAPPTRLRDVQRLTEEFVARISSLEREVERLHALEAPIARAGFSVEMSADMTDVVVGTDHTVTYNTEIFDIGGDFNTATYTFTAPVNGVYLLIHQVRLSDVDSAASYVRIQIVTSNRTYRQYYPSFTMAADSAFVGLEVCAIADMDASDTAYATVRAQAGAAQMDVISGAGAARFMGWLIG